MNRLLCEHIARVLFAYTFEGIRAPYYLMMRDRVYWDDNKVFPYTPMRLVAYNMIRAVLFPVWRWSLSALALQSSRRVLIGVLSSLWLNVFVTLPLPCLAKWARSSAQSCFMAVDRTLALSLSPVWRSSILRALQV